MHASSRVALKCSQSTALPTFQTPPIFAALPPAPSLPPLMLYSTLCQVIRFNFTSLFTFVHLFEATTP